MKDERIKEYLFQDDKGDAQIKVYSLFPGVEVAFVNVHMADFDFTCFESEEKKDYLLIRYCLEGHIEQELQQEFFYLMSGDISISFQNTNEKKYRFPLKHYHGISIGINLNEQNALISYLNDCECSMEEVIHKSLSHIVLRDSKVFKHYFKEWYQVEDQYKYDYLKMKLPELFYHIKYHQEDAIKDALFVPRSQVEFVKEVSCYIDQNIIGKMTLKQLTYQFGVSDTYLQNAFRSVYGMPVMSYIRVQKMHRVAQVLIHTSKTIEEIAQEYGYENESKFSQAFKKIMGDTPSVYRKEHSKIKIR